MEIRERCWLQNVVNALNPIKLYRRRRRKRRSRSRKRRRKEEGGGRGGGEEGVMLP